MKIKEVAERDCCDWAKGDFIAYHGMIKEFENKIFICKHCGEIWITENFTDAVDGDYYNIPLFSSPLFIESLKNIFFPGKCIK